MHVCPLTCGKLLGCGLHTCPKPDHKGACGRCLQASYDEVSDGGAEGTPPLTPHSSSFATVGTPLSTHRWPAARPSPVFSLAPATHHLVATPSPRTTATSRPSAHRVPISPPSPAHAARIPRSRTSDAPRTRCLVASSAAYCSGAAIIGARNRVILPGCATLALKRAARPNGSVNTRVHRLVTLPPNAPNPTRARRLSPSPALVVICRTGPPAEPAPPIRRRARRLSSSATRSAW
jgi:transcriptional repressor NF-X1